MSNVIALVRKPSPSFINALSKHPLKDTINFARSMKQHEQYAQILDHLGVHVFFLNPLKDCPDSVFVEDTAILTDEGAFLCSPREENRRSEISSVLLELEKLRKVEVLRPPILIDGGDVLQTEHCVFIGLSKRTNQQAVDFFRSKLNRKVVPVPVKHSLHLKTVATYLGKGVIVADPSKIDVSLFSDFEIIESPPKEHYAANTLAIGNRVILPKGFPQLTQILQERGWKVFLVDISEFEKADGGVTCLSLIIN